jgi:hypothetical protein
MRLKKLMFFALWVRKAGSGFWRFAATIDPFNNLFGQ